MNDKKFSIYVDNLSKLDLSNFSQHIEAFSNFLSYVDPDYKYNGTYLKQYIGEFEKTCLSLPNKDKKYKKITTKILIMANKCDTVDVMVDNVFHGYCSYLNNNLKENKYIAFDRDKMINNSIEIRIIFGKNNEEYVFHKKYDDIENQLVNRVCKDVNTFLKYK